MPEVCPHCADPIESVRKAPDGEQLHEVWRCENCDEEWRHPEETVLSRELDFSRSEQQLSKRDSATDTGW